MVLEIADIIVKPGEETAFEAAVTQAKPIFAAAPDCHGMSLRRSIESPGNYRLLIEWTSVEAHNAFRASEAFGAWRGLAGPFFAAPPVVEHYEQAV